MYQYPKHFNTLQDYDNCHALALEGKLSKQRLIEEYQALLNTNNHYIFDKIITTYDERDGDEPGYKVLMTGEETEEWTQFKLSINSNSRLNQLGLAIEQVSTRINELEEV